MDFLSNKATVCVSGGNCVTVYGNTAKIFGGIALLTLILIAIGTITKAWS